MRGYDHDEARHQWFATHLPDYNGHIYADELNQEPNDDGHTDEHKEDQSEQAVDPKR